MQVAGCFMCHQGSALLLKKANDCIQVSSLQSSPTAQQSLLHIVRKGGGLCCRGLRCPGYDLRGQHV